MISNVYSNAVCVIAFLFPPHVGSTENQFTTKRWSEQSLQARTRRPDTQIRNDHRPLTPCIIREPTETRMGIYIGSCEEGECSRLEAENWPWSSRAWTFQEHILSARTILYGHRTIMWDRVEIFCDELTGTVLAPGSNTRQRLSRAGRKANASCGAGDNSETIRI